MASSCRLFRGETGIEVEQIPGSEKALVHLIENRNSRVTKCHWGLRSYRSITHRTSLPRITANDSGCHEFSCERGIEIFVQKRSLHSSS
jgi:hypothetical protein